MTQNYFDLTGKVALVTGATHGLGMAIAIGLANAGAKIVVNDIIAEKLEHAKKRICSKWYIHFQLCMRCYQRTAGKRNACRN